MWSAAQKDTCGQSYTRSWRARRSHVWCSSAVTHPTPQNSVEHKISFKNLNIWVFFCFLFFFYEISVCIYYSLRCLDQSPHPPWRRERRTSEKYSIGQTERQNTHQQMHGLTVCSWRTAWAWCRRHRPRQWRRQSGGWWRTSSDGRRSPCLGWRAQTSSPHADL